MLSASLTQAIGFGAGSLSEQDVRTMLGTIDRQAVSRIVAAVIAGDGPGLFAEIDQLASRGTDFQALLDELIGLLHGIAVEQAVPGIAVGRRAGAPALDQFARALSGEDVQIFYQMALNGRRDFPYVPDPRRGFEMVALRLLTFRPLAAGEIELGSDSEGGESVPAAPEPETRATGDPAPSQGLSGGALGDSPGGLAGKKSDPVCPVGNGGTRGGLEQLQQPAGLAGSATPEQTSRQARVPKVEPAPTPAPAPALMPESALAAPLGATPPLRLEALQPVHWNRLFSELKISGVTRNIAANTVLSEVSGNHLRLVLDVQQALVYNEQHRQRLQAALGDYFDQSIELEVTSGEPPGETPALYRQRIKAERLQSAIVELEQDPNVQMLQEHFGGVLQRDSVRILD